MQTNLEAKGMEPEADKEDLLDLRQVKVDRLDLSQVKLDRLELRQVKVQAQVCHILMSS
jgi:hypothetical protein